MTPHTPGPWEINGQGWDVYVISTNDPDTTICKMEVLSDENGSTQVTIDNANLITAAPDLLAACMALIGEGNPPVGQPGHVDYVEAVHQARAAIRKAKGSAQ